MTVKLFDTYEDLLNALCLDSKKEELALEFPTDPAEIETLDQVLTLISFLEENHRQASAAKYRRLVACKDTIAKINNMIGLTEAKTNLAQQILSLCERAMGDGASSGSKINSVIYGPPGCGKTTLAHALADLYLKMEAVTDNKLVKGDRSNMIGEYLGQTAVKTKKLLQSALGGVLFIDEAYQLGHAADGNRCPFAYECINTINQFITENPGKIVIILAGYQKDIEQNFFAQNDGLARRFPFKYTITGYTEQELYLIFRQQAQAAGFAVSADAVSPEIFTNKRLFQFYGGDTENLFNCCRMFHDKRMFALLKSDNILNKVDFERGLALFRKQKELTAETSDGDGWRNMYM
jgi:SpoVK/Ycf46/Vps4 family AAA+-type ATPase